MRRQRMVTPMMVWAQAARAAQVAAAVLLAATALAATGCEEVPDPVRVTAEDSSSEQRLAVGQELRVTLEANPTTGYEWTIDGELPAALDPAYETEYLAASDGVGAGGSETWTFQAAEPGTGLLRLKYWRSFEPTTPPEDDFEVKVIVE